MEPNSRFRTRAWRFAKSFYWKAYEDNVTGQSAMVAYNLLLSILPFGLFALFVVGQVIESQSLRESVLTDLRRLFPDTEENTLANALDNVEKFSTRAGIAALIASIWIGSSFWGAMDTAFCRIYHVRCRTWVEQKRFALVMLLVVLLFMAATVVVPTVQSILYNGANDLPLGLDEVRGVIYVVTLIGALVTLFLVLCIIYWAVPNRNVPWQAVWPGAAAATLAIGLVDYAFPFYLSNIATINQLGSTLVFITIVLFWFYAIAFFILCGATVNALRFERFDTDPDAGVADAAEAPSRPDGPCADC